MTELGYAQRLHSQRHERVIFTQAPGFLLLCKHPILISMGWPLRAAGHVPMLPAAAPAIVAAVPVTGSMAYIKEPDGMVEVAHEVWECLEERKHMGVSNNCWCFGEVRKFSCPVCSARQSCRCSHVADKSTPV